MAPRQRWRFAWACPMVQQATPELAAALMEFCRQHISHVKCPRTVDFVTTLPRLKNGKLYKRLLLNQYAAAAAADPAARN